MLWSKEILVQRSVTATQVLSNIGSKGRLSLTPEKVTDIKDDSRKLDKKISTLPSLRHASRLKIDSIASERMDLMKSLDSILTRPYSGPNLSSLQPLLQRNNLKRPVRNPTHQVTNPPRESTLNRFPVRDIPTRKPASSSSSTSSVSFSKNKHHKQEPILIEDNAIPPKVNHFGQKFQDKKPQEELLSAPNFFTPFNFGNNNWNRPNSPKGEQFPSSFVQSANSFGTVSHNDRPIKFDLGRIESIKQHQSQVQPHRTNVRNRRPQVHHQQTPIRSQTAPVTHYFTFQDDVSKQSTLHSANSGQDFKRPSRNAEKFVTFDEALNYHNGQQHLEENEKLSNNPYGNEHKYPQNVADSSDVHVHQFIKSTNGNRQQKKKVTNSLTFPPKWGFFGLPSLFSKNRSKRETIFKDDSKTEGFMSGKPSGFPDFQQISGFGSLPELSPESSNFVPDFQLPTGIHIAKMDGLSFPSQFEVVNGNFGIDRSTKEKRSADKEHIQLNGDQISSYSHHHRTVGRKGVNLQPRTLIRVPRQFNPFLPFHPPHPSHRFGHHSHFQPFAPHQKQNRKGAFDGHGGFHPNQRHPKSISSFHGGNHFNGGHQSVGPLPLAPQLPAGLSEGFHSSGPRKEQTTQFDHEPEYNSFASNQLKKQKPLDSSLLGSGNFEIIKGGTFYGKDDPHLNHHPYDHFLDGGPIYYAGNRPHTNNHVDDFFSNFRDFSEFAARRSDIKEEKYDGSFDDGFFERGFASEHLPVVFKITDMMTSESMDDKIDGYKTNKTLTKEDMKRKTKKANYSDLKMAEIKSKKNLKNKSKRKPEKKYRKRKPKNIQDVLRELDSNQNYNPTYHANDPLIAMF